MEQIIEIRYAGILVGQATAVRDLTATGVFVGINDPMPVGTILSLKTGNQITDGRVEHVTESGEPGHAGMRIRFVDNGAVVAGKLAVVAPASAVMAPAPASAAPAPVAAPAAPVPVDAAPSQASAAPSEEAGEGDSDRIPAPTDLGGSGPQNLDGGGGRRRRRRR